MELSGQKSAVEALEMFSKNNIHSIILSGIVGSGKTYLAKQYANMLDISDFNLIKPSVSNARDIVENSINLENQIVFCIENLDTGVLSTSYALLKFLEEPRSNIYIIITCRNINAVPDTIISRSSHVVVAPPLMSDIDKYAENKDPTKFNRIRSKPLWKCIKNLNDVDKLYNLSDEQFNYIDNINNIINLNNPISTSVWSLGHFDDGTETPLDLIINRIILDNLEYRKFGIRCIDAIERGRISSYAILSNFMFDIKYSISYGG